ncbi:Oidioi.mRNA.OKI2018_I69.chr2.g4829.t1.cds [Oikopleura dioica]|uniref:Oidioi.mRNA.OKI2018_I69.chr2.g4829.t1.cds n=1 Tax=Oikopleura dioica TaxID=34765 RepID=A0ABN7T1V9_OIKDI|nr:Oidioi.mRNA.OKI2018_I69.chr2.g4829.t1.cds [Oikopleura dioica]
MSKIIGDQTIDMEALSEMGMNKANTATLSGGERSISTVILLIAIWHATSSPFRCIDKFDVYMDAHHKHMATHRPRPDDENETLEISSSDEETEILTPEFFAQAGSRKWYEKFSATGEWRSIMERDMTTDVLRGLQTSDDHPRTLEGLEALFYKNHFCGWLRCVGFCADKNKPFRAYEKKSGQEYNIKKDALRSHLRTKHKNVQPNQQELAQSSQFRSFARLPKIKDHDKETHRENNAAVIASQHLSLGFWQKSEVVERDRHLLASVGVNPDVLRDFGPTSSYGSKQELKKCAENLKKIVSKNVPELCRRGIVTLSGDHKSIQGLTKDGCKNGLSILIHLQRGSLNSNITLDFVGSETTDDETTSRILADVLKSYGLTDVWNAKRVNFVADSKLEESWRKTLWSSQSAGCTVSTVCLRAFKTMQESSSLKNHPFFSPQLNMKRTSPSFLKPARKLSQTVAMTSSDALRIYKQSHKGDISAEEALKKVATYPKLKSSYRSIRFSSDFEKYSTLAAHEKNFMKLRYETGDDIPQHLAPAVQFLPCFKWIKAKEIILRELHFLQKECEKDSSKIIESILACERLLVFFCNVDLQFPNEQTTTEYLSILARAGIRKTMLMICGKVFVPRHKKKDGTIQEAKTLEKGKNEPVRINDAHKAALFLQWQSRRCRLGDAQKALESRGTSKDEFYSENLSILKEQVQTWQSEAKEFIESFAQTFPEAESEQTDENTASQEVTQMMTNQLRFDPEDQPLVAQKQNQRREPRTNLEKIQDQIAQYENDQAFPEWIKSTVKTKKLDPCAANFYSEILLLYWNQQKERWPMLSEVALKIASLPSTSATIERSFAVMDYDLDKHRCNQTCEHIAHLAITAKYRQFTATLKKTLELEDACFPAVILEVICLESKSCSVHVVPIGGPVRKKSPIFSWRNLVAGITKKPEEFGKYYTVIKTQDEINLDSRYAAVNNRLNGVIKGEISDYQILENIEIEPVQNFQEKVAEAEDDLEETLQSLSNLNLNTTVAELEDEADKEKSLASEMASAEPQQDEDIKEEAPSPFDTKVEDFSLVVDKPQHEIIEETKIEEMPGKGPDNLDEAILEDKHEEELQKALEHFRVVMSLWTVTPTRNVPQMIEPTYHLIKCRAQPNTISQNSTKRITLNLGLSNASLFFFMQE